MKFVPLRLLFILLLTIVFTLPLKSGEIDIGRKTLKSFNVEKIRREARIQHEFLVNSQKRILKKESFEADKIKVDILNTHYFDNVVVFSRKTLSAVKPSGINSTIRFKAIFNKDRIMGIYCYIFSSDNTTGPDYACIFNKKGMYLGIAQVKSSDINYFRFITTEKPSPRTQTYINLAKRLYAVWLTKKKKSIVASW